MTAAMSPPLQDAALAHYRDKGWAVARGLFSPAQAGAMADWCDDLLAMEEKPGAHWVYREPSLLDPSAKVIQRIENFCPFHPGFDALVRTGTLSAAMAQLLDGPACLFKDKINFKEPGGAGFEPHQDQQAGWSRYAPLFVTALVSIDRSDTGNGCLEMPDIPRLTGMIGEEWKPLSADATAGSQLVPVPTEPGDVIFFDSYAPHASKPNLSSDVRRILYLTYNSAALGDHRAQYFADKRASFPPDIERVPGREYKFRV